MRSQEGLARRFRIDLLREASNRVGRQDGGKHAYSAIVFDIFGLLLGDISDFKEFICAVKLHVNKDSHMIRALGAAFDLRSLMNCSSSTWGAHAHTRG